jgi:putative ABC transport system ATP-binding protein
MDTAVEFNEVSKRHGAGAAQVVALDRVSLRVPVGQMTTVTGPSGSGKTTLLFLAGLLDEPSEGEIRLFGEIPASNTHDRALLRRRWLGFVFQSFNLIPTLSALENVEMSIILDERDPALRRQRAVEALVSVGLGDMLGRRPHHLSGGQQQRVALARAMVRRPRLILADEPTASLDRASAQSVLAHLRTWVDRDGMTILISSHDSLVMDFSDQLIPLAGGRLQFAAEPSGPAYARDRATGAI